MKARINGKIYEGTYNAEYNWFEVWSANDSEIGCYEMAYVDIIKTNKVNTLEEFYANVAYWNRYGTLTHKSVKVRAKNRADAYSRIEKRFPSAYDISM